MQNCVIKQALVCAMRHGCVRVHVPTQAKNKRVGTGILGLP